MYLEKGEKGNGESDSKGHRISDGGPSEGSMVAGNGGVRMVVRMRTRLERGNRSRVLERGLLGGGVAMFGNKVGLPESRRMTYTVQFQETLRPSESRSTTPVYLTQSLFVIVLSRLSFATTKCFPTRQFFVIVLQHWCYFDLDYGRQKRALGFDRLRLLIWSGLWPSKRQSCCCSSTLMRP